MSTSQPGSLVYELIGGEPGKLRAYAPSMKRDITADDEAARFFAFHRRA